MGWKWVVGRGESSAGDVSGDGVHGEYGGGDLADDMLRVGNTRDTERLGGRERGSLGCAVTD